MSDSHAAEKLAYARPPARPLEAPPAIRRACLAAFVLIGAYLALIGALFINEQWPDFEYFYKAGAWLWEHGSLDRGVDLLPGGLVVPRGSIEWYLPFTSRVMTLIAWLPYRTAGFIWVALNVVAMFTTVRLIGRHLMGLPPRDWPVTMLLPFLFLIVFWYWEYRLNQIDILTLLLLVATFVHWQQGHQKTAGLWLGLAVLLKLTPGLLGLWFVLKRQFRVVGVAVLTFVLAGPVSDLIVFRPGPAIEEYRIWVREAVHRASHRRLVLAQVEMDWRNQGLGAVLSRWLHPTSYATRFDNEPRAPASPYPKLVNVAHLTPETIANVVTGVLALSLVGLLVLARRPGRVLNLWQLRLEWALFVLAMLWFMPVMRRYHMIWALPAMALLAAGVHHVGWRRWWSILALIAMFIVVGSQVALISKEFVGTNLVEGYGITLLAVIALAVPLVTILLWLARNSAAVSQDVYAAASTGDGPADQPAHSHA
jgi:hypothetical protein